MKKIFLSCIAVLLLSSVSVFAYSPTLKDTTQLNKLYPLLDTLSYTNPSKLSEIGSKIEKIIDSLDIQSKNYFLLSEIRKYISFQEGKTLGKDVNVIDGDTLSFSLNGTREKLRIIGINAPEIATTSEYYGEEAKKYLSERIQGKDVYIETDSTQAQRDKYDRTLGYVFYRQEDIGKTLIEKGYAREYTYDKAYKYQKDYKEAENLAEKNLLGLWSTGNLAPISDETQKPSYPSTLSFYDPNDTSYLDMGFSCTGKKKYCSYMSSCDEVKYFFYVCSAKTFDGDKDGIPCENICGEK